jgi:hypothetical protein
MLLFCIPSGPEWARAGVTGATATAEVVKGLIERDAGDNQGRPRGARRNS